MLIAVAFCGGMGFQMPPLFRAPKAVILKQKIPNFSSMKNSGYDL